ncbi:PTS sugar transporter [Actinomyces oris]|uniref:PTS sugar transporter n=1 Tax=Actinomyces oris TaxID=544580 RepID=A0A508BUE1_9ACTO|nr:PTS sugar transporter [Actinomyces oris]QQC39310.1 PTS sugar transporter [Actinomyces oris]TQD63135.1 PTS sugar transporter [Actinomyces oris]
MIAMLSAVSAPSVLAATSSTSSAVTFVAGVVGGIVAGIVLYLLVYRYSARHLPEVRAEEASELLKKLGQQQTSFVCALPTGIMVSFVFPATSHLSAGPLPLVVHLMGAAMIGVSIVGVAWLSPRLRAVRNAAAA